MRLVILLAGILAVCAAALVFSVYDYARKGSVTSASRPVTSATAGTPDAGPSPEAALPAPPALVAAAPVDTAAAGGPVAMAPSAEEAPAALAGQPDAPAAPSRGEHRVKDHGGGHGKHDHPSGG